ncbi:MAG: CBS domain-containing protein [Cellvibrionales bacterium]|nr:CBS domain-containing protein [Cellvibrionales bacterium]
MRENPAKVLESAEIYDAIRIILDHGLSGLTVVDEENNVKGVVSELDCLRAVIGSAYNESSYRVGTVSEYMSHPVDACHPEDSAFEVAQDMLAKNQRRRPVVKDGKLIGQVSCRNVLWAIGNYTGALED